MDNKAVFISYVRDDSAAVDRIAANLRTNGVQVWLDRDNISPGDRWRHAIRRAIRDGAYFIACFSPAYAQRERSFVHEELVLALDELRSRPPDRRWFIPVVLNGGKVPDRDIGGGETLQDIQHVDFSDNWDLAMARLLQAVSNRDYVADPAASVLRNAATETAETVQKARVKWQADPSFNFFGESEFTQLRHAVQANGARNQLSSDDYRWLLLGALYDGNIPGSLLPSPDDPAILYATRFWLKRRAPRGPRYRSAALLERCTAPGRDEMIEAALAESGFRRASELAEAIRSQTVITFIEDPNLSYDLDPSDSQDRRQRKYMIEFWEKLRDYYT
jgi:TIR domain